MGLDIYVGSLTRYYAGNWKTILQQESPYPVTIVRPEPPRQGWVSRLLDRLDHKDTDEDSAALVARWQKQVQQALDMPNLDWNEDPNSEYFTDKPGWDCYGALLLWAVYEEFPNAGRRETPEGWEKDPALSTAMQNPEARYPHLTGDTEIWLPVDFPSPIKILSVTGDTTGLGSSVQLLRELSELNERTWRAAEEQVGKWPYDGSDYEGPLEQSAQFAFSIFHELARRSVNHRLPMKLDY